MLLRAQYGRGIHRAQNRWGIQRNTERGAEIFEYSRLDVSNLLVAGIVQGAVLWVRHESPVWLANADFRIRTLSLSNPCKSTQAADEYNETCEDTKLVSFNLLRVP